MMDLDEPDDQEMVFEDEYAPKVVKPKPASKPAKSPKKATGPLAALMNSSKSPTKASATQK